jgi:hypothetical protein
MAFVHKVLGYEFHFRNLEWVEESLCEGRRALIERALMSVSGRPVTPEESGKILSAFNDEAIDKLFFMYQNSLPEDRAWSLEFPWAPPDPKIMTTFRPSEEVDDE